MTSLDLLQMRLGDRYRIERELGKGGMGAVYLARETRLDRPVALKVLPTEYAVLPALRERFLRESRMSAGFSHPNIVPVYAVEETEDLLAYAMGYVEGESLAERVARSGPLSVRETVKLLQDVSYALAYAHGRGVVHRDIKPDNVMIERATGRALVMDFGIARPIATPGARADGLTRVGEVVGTPEYMSPEQAAGDHVDGRSDLYSLGLTAHFALTGEVAMRAESLGKVLARQIAEELPPIAELRADIPDPLARAIDRCLSKDPANRFERAEALVEALEAAQLTRPEIPVRIRLLAQELSTLSLIVVAALGFAAWQFRPMTAGDSDLDRLLPVVLVLAVMVTRILQSGREIRRILAAGWPAGDVTRGMRAVVDEAGVRREELRADQAVLRARRRTIVIAALQLPLAVLLIRLAFGFRTEVAEGNYVVAPAGVVLVISGIALLGVSIVLLARSPLRMPLGERLFRLFWLGPLGRAFFALAARGVKTPGGSQVPRPARARPEVGLRAAAPASDDRRIAALEARLTALERRTTAVHGSG